MALQQDQQSTTTPDVTLTDRAASELVGMIAEHKQNGAALRVWVAGGGCSGLQYGMALDDGEPEAEDVMFSDKGVKIIVDPLSLKYLKGAHVDYVDDVLGGGFKIENPNAVKSCGCGSSFASEEEGIEGLATGGGGCGGCGCGSK